MISFRCETCFSLVLHLLQESSLLITVCDFVISRTALHQASIECLYITDPLSTCTNMYISNDPIQHGYRGLHSQDYMALFQTASTKVFL